MMTCRSCRRLRSFDLDLEKQNQKIAAFGSSYRGTGQLVRHAAAVQYPVDHQFTEHDHLMQHQHGPALWVIGGVADITGHVAGGG